MITLYNRLLVALILFISLWGSVSAQDTDALIFKAMNDELERSMQDLKYQDYNAPFYVFYSVNDLFNYTVQASLGAVIDSNANSKVFCNTRLMVGDYKLNDEKFSDKVNRVSYNDGGYTSLKNPNYYGIRRGLWLQTNNLYKGALEKYKNKCDLMQKEGISIDDLKSQDFSEEPVVEYLEPRLANEKDPQFFEDWAKELSRVFAKYTDVIESDVLLKYANQTSYIVDSEGRKVQLPSRLYSVVIKAKILSGENKPMTQYLRYYAQQFEELPVMDDMKSDIEALVNNLLALKVAPKYHSKYEGPVMFQGEAVFYKGFISLVRRGAGLLASPRALVNDANKGLGLATSFTWEDMKGKRVIDKKLSVSARPHLESYQGHPLLGTAICDYEGVKTPEKIELISAGILKNQLNNRTPMPSQPHSNGHSRPYYINNSFSQQLMTSVLQLEAHNALPLDSLYCRLVNIAREEGLDHAICIKPLETHANESPINIYKIDLESGKEELVVGASYYAKVSELKKIEALGDQHLLTNTLVANQANVDKKRKQMANYPEWIKDIIRMQMGDEGAPSSFIYPSAMLLESTTITGTNKAYKSKPRVVPSPLAHN